MNAEEKKLQFVDTNVFLYAYDVSDPVKQEKAAALVKDMWNKKKGCVSIQVLQELYVNLTKKIPQPISRAEAAQIIKDLGQWKCHSPDLASLEQTIDLENRFQVSFWDAMIINSAQQMQCAVLWTEDLNAGQDYEGVLVKNPFLLD